MFRNVRFLTIEKTPSQRLMQKKHQNKAKQNEQKNNTENHFIPKNALFYTQSLNTEEYE